MKSATLPNILLILASLVPVEVGAFSSLSRHYRQHDSAFFATNANDIGVEEWTSLTDCGGVKMSVMSSSDNDAAVEDLPFPDKGKDVTVEYIGSIAPRDWSVDDILACWLPDQGLTALAPELFEAFDIDGAKLANAKKFNEKFIVEGLGVRKEAKVTTLLEAVQDLERSERTHPAGTVFDKNQFTFRLGKGMSIRAFDLAVSRMKVGQTVSLVARCDYAYGKRGLRAAGKILVPPYATVQYDLTLVEIK